MTVMAHIGSLSVPAQLERGLLIMNLSSVPAQYASFPIVRQLYARVSMDDSIEANMSTFAAEMRETAFILRNVDKSSMSGVSALAGVA